MLEGLVKGIPKGQKKPMIDGILSGLPRKDHKGVAPELSKCTPSATQYSKGVFGAGATPEGDGDAKSGGKSFKGMKLAY